MNTKSSVLCRSRVYRESFDPVRQHADLHTEASRFFIIFHLKVFSPERFIIFRENESFLFSLEVFVSPESIILPESISDISPESPVELGTAFHRDCADLNAKSEAEKVEIDGIDRNFH
jgi:hypothetical protein